VYLEGVYQRSSGGTGTVLDDASINTLSPSSTGRQLAVTVGMRHQF
jgi:predicted porin